MAHRGRDWDPDEPPTQHCSWNRAYWAVSDKRDSLAPESLEPPPPEASSPALEPTDPLPPELPSTGANPTGANPTGANPTGANPTGSSGELEPVAPDPVPSGVAPFRSGATSRAVAPFRPPGGLHPLGALRSPGPPERSAPDRGSGPREGRGVSSRWGSILRESPGHTHRTELRPSEPPSQGMRRGAARWVEPVRPTRPPPPALPSPPRPSPALPSPPRPSPPRPSPALPSPPRPSPALPSPALWAPSVPGAPGRAGPQQRSSSTPRSVERSSSSPRSARRVWNASEAPTAVIAELPEQHTVIHPRATQLLPAGDRQGRPSRWISVGLLLLGIPPLIFLVVSLIGG